jgi:hypothetical protein
MENKKIIANPLYDTAFKCLMENMEIALFLIKTIIGEQVVEIEVAPQERIIKKTRTKKVDDNKQQTISEEVFSIIRYDFIAKIRNEQGNYKNVLIEIQKSNNPGNLKRFKSYIGELYKKVDLVDGKKGKIEKSLPVIGIFILGFKLPIEAAVIKVNRQYIDVIANKKILKRIDFIESLTHDGYFIQIPYVSEKKPSTDLEKILSLFEQRSFVDKNIKKTYEYPIDNNIIRKMIDVLCYVAADPQQQKLLEAEWFAKSEEEEFENMEKELAEKKMELAEKKMELAEKKIELTAEKNARKAAEKENADLRRQLAKLQKNQIVQR